MTHSPEEKNLRMRISLCVWQKLSLRQQLGLSSMALQCPWLREVDLTECEALTDSVCDVFSEGGGCPKLNSLTLDNCEVWNVSWCPNVSILELTNRKELWEGYLRTMFCIHWSKYIGGKYAICLWILQEHLSILNRCLPGYIYLYCMIFTRIFMSTWLQVFADLIYMLLWWVCEGFHFVMFWQIIPHWIDFSRNY